MPGGLSVTIDERKDARLETFAHMPRLGERFHRFVQPVLLLQHSAQFAEGYRVIRVDCAARNCSSASGHFFLAAAASPAS